MTHSKSELRRLLRARRADNVRGGSIDEAVGQGLTTQWENACLFFGVRPWCVETLPALFVPTVSEPPIWEILHKIPRSLLPIVWNQSREDESWSVLSEPAWGLHLSGSPLASTPHPWPAQPSSPVLSDALREADIVLAPALAIDEDGARLGYGGGWYDRALSVLRPDVIVVSVVFDEEFLPAGMIPVEPHDRFTDAVITPTSFIPLPVHGT